MLRFGIALVLLALLASAACKAPDKPVGRPTGVGPGATSEATTSSVVRTPDVRPTAVPPAARVIDRTATLGRITRSGGTPQAAALRGLRDASCGGDLMALVTSDETIYAALPCDRFLDDATKQRFVGTQVAIVLEVTEERYRLLLETLDGAQAEFTVDGIWVQ